MPKNIPPITSTATNIINILNKDVEVVDPVRYNIIHSSLTKTDGSLLVLVRIFYESKKDIPSQSICVDITHIPNLTKSSSITHNIYGFEVPRIFFKDNQQGNIYATADGNFLFKPNQGKSVEISKEDLLKEKNYGKQLEINQIPDGISIS